MKYTATCRKCERVFDKDADGKPYTSQEAAAKGVAMHNARVHTKAIIVPSGRRRRELVLAGTTMAEENGHSDHSALAVYTAENNKIGRGSKLTNGQKDLVLNYIREHMKDSGVSRTDIFVAALSAAHAAGKIQPNSSAVCRYFRIASGQPDAPRKGKGKRKNSMALALVDQPAQLIVSHKHGTLVKQCPRCGLVIDGAEDIFQLLQENPEVVHLALAAARKMMARKMQQIDTE